MPEIPAVSGKITADASGFTSAVDEAKRKLEEFGTSSAKAGEQLGQLGSQMGGAVGGMGGLASALTGVAAGMFDLEKGIEILHGLYSATVDWGNSLQILHERSGLAISTIAAFQESAEVFGVTAETMATAMDRLAMGIDTGSKKAALGLQQLGIDLNQFSGMDQEARLQAITEGFAGIEEATKRAAIAGELFGRGGYALLPALTEDAENFRKKLEEVAPTTAAAALEARKWKEDVALLTAEWEHLERTIGRVVLEAAKLIGNTLSGKATSVMNQILGTGEEDLPTVKTKVFKAVAPTLEQPTSAATASWLQEQSDAAAKAAEAAAKRFAEAWNKAEMEWVKGMDAAAAKNREAMDALFEKFGPDAMDVAFQFGQIELAIDKIGGVAALTDSQLENLQHQLSTIASLQGGFLDPKQWDLVASAAQEAAARAKEEGDYIEVGNGLWERHRVVADATLKDIAEGEKRAADEAQKLREHWEALQSLFSSISQLGSAIGGGFGGALSTLAGAGGGISQALQGMQAQGGFGFGSLGQIAGSIGFVGSIINAGKAVFDVIKGIFSTPVYQQVMEEVGKNWGVSISEGLAKQIEADMGKFSLSKTTAESLHVGDIMAEAVKAGQDPGALWGQVKGAMEGIKLGAIPAAEGLKQLGDAFGQLQKAAEAGSIQSEAAMIKMIETARNLGEVIPGMSEAIHSMLVGSAQGLTQFFGGISPGGGGAAQSAASQELFGATYEGLVAQEGVIKAAEDTKAAFDALIKSMPAGTQLTGAAAEAAQMNKLLENKEFKGAADAATGLAKALKGLEDSANLSQKTLDAFGVSTETAYNQALSGAQKTGLMGTDAEKAALQAILPMLTQLQHAQALGAKLTPSEEALLTKAQTAGILPLKDVATQQLGVLQDIRGLLGGAGGPSGGGGAAGAGGTSTLPYGGPIMSEGGPRKGSAENPIRAQGGLFSSSLPYGPNPGGTTSIEAHPGERVSIGNIPNDMGMGNDVKIYVTANHKSDDEIVDLIRRAMRDGMLRTQVQRTSTGHL